MDVSVEKRTMIVLPTYNSEQSMVSTKMNLGMKLNEDDFKIILQDALDYNTKNDKDKTIKFIMIKYGKLDQDMIDRVFKSLRD